MTLYIISMGINNYSGRRTASHVEIVSRAWNGGYMKKQLTILSLESKANNEWRALVENVTEEARYADEYVYEVINPKYRVTSEWDVMINTIISSMELRSSSYSGKTMHTVVIVCPEKNALSDELLEKLKLRCWTMSHRNRKIRWEFVVSEDNGYKSSISDICVGVYDGSELEQWYQILTDIAAGFRSGKVVA